MRLCEYLDGLCQQSLRKYWAIKKMIHEYHATKESILEDYSEEEYRIAIRELAEK